MTRPSNGLAPQTRPSQTDSNEAAFSPEDAAFSRSHTRKEISDDHRPTQPVRFGER